MEELYEQMKQKLDELYESEDGNVVLEYTLFFPLYKMVCDMMQIRGVIRQYE